MHPRMLRIALVAALTAGCGSDISKDGTASNSGANQSPGPTNNTTPTPGQNMEQGSPDAAVLDAWNRLGPLMCAYDATCTEPLLDEACPFQTGATGSLNGQCWVVDAAGVAACEGALRGRQCEGTWTNFPQECATAMRQCECLDGYERAWPDDADQEGCYPTCQTSDSCGAARGCYDGVCLPDQEGRCADDEVFGADGCLSRCDDGVCDDGFSCIDGVCMQDDVVDP